MSDDSDITDINGHDDRALSRLYRSGARPQPPEGLDAAIKSAARTARGQRRGHAIQWLGGLAASLVAAVLVIQLYPRTVQQPELASDAREAQKNERAAQPPEEQKARRSAPPVVPDRVSPLAPRLPQPAASSRAERARSAESETDRGSAGLMVLPDGKQGPLPTTQQDLRGSPDRELETIAALLDSGDITQARQRLAELRARYPGFEIPEKMLRRFPAAESTP